MPVEPEPFEDRPQTSPPAADKEARLWAMLCHLSVLAGHLVVFGQIIGPLVIWLLKKDQFPFVDDQGREALNFRITLYILYAIGIVLTLVFCFFIPFLAILGVFDLVMTIIAAIKAYDGVAFRYPLTIRLI